MHSSTSLGSQREARKRSELTNVQRSYEKVEGPVGAGNEATRDSIYMP